METKVIGNKTVLNKKNLIENCNGWEFCGDSELFAKVFGGGNQENQDIKIENLGKDGDVVFSLPQKAMGLSDDDMQKYPILRSNYFTNFIGEFLVRKNIGKFLKMLLEMRPEEYKKVVCSFNHKNFGMFVCSKSKTLKFQFHISLVQSILTEDLNKIISFKK